jgi:hypothetical protein
LVRAEEDYGIGTIRIFKGAEYHLFGSRVPPVIGWLPQAPCDRYIVVIAAEGKVFLVTRAEQHAPLKDAASTIDGHRCEDCKERNSERNADQFGDTPFIA